MVVNDWVWIGPSISGWNTTGKKKKSDVWEHFEQIAHERTGEPKVMGKYCSTVLAHPNHKRAGTSALKTYLKGNTCRIDKEKRGPLIDQMIGTQ